MSFMANHLYASDLPDERVLSVAREDLVAFRKDYQTIAEFAAYVCGVGLSELCPMHMLLYMRAHSEEVQP